MIKILNFSSFETVSYSLPLLSGEVLGVTDGEIEVACDKTDQVTKWPVILGTFKVLVSLKPGKNIITLKCKTYIRKFSLIYSPLSCKRFIKLVYITCCDSDTFQSPPEEDNGAESACKRICLGAQMLQTFTASKLKRHNLKPKTFKLEEIDGNVICHVYRSSLCLQDALKMTEEELWKHFAIELMNSPLREGDKCKFLAVLSFTRYVNDSGTVPESHKEIKALTKGYAALGAGGLALVGSVCLHTWPSSLSEVSWRFGDNRKIDRLKFMDDSRNRGYYWACYATNLGAMLHELGHTFDLGHTEDGIMSRGFDNIHKFFIHDIFYSSHPFQKKYNPYYKVSVIEQTSVTLLKSPTVTWSMNAQVGSTSAKTSQPVTVKMPGLSQLNTKPPWKVPDPPDDDVCKDEAIHGSYWARSSALILHFHKWFNEFDDEPIEITCQGSVFSSPHGIRVIEFRDESNTAFHHLEYLDNSAITTSVDVRQTVPKSSIPASVEQSTVFVEDSKGGILHRTLNVELISF